MTSNYAGRMDYRRGYADGQLDLLARIRDSSPTLWAYHEATLMSLVLPSPEESRA